MQQILFAVEPSTRETGSHMPTAIDTAPLVLGHRTIETLSANTVVVGTGSAGYCAAVRLAEFGQDDVVMVADKVRAGASRNAGSDKQTYYKLTLSGSEPDSVREMAQTLFSGGAMDGDNALAEAALSARAFLHLVDLGVPFPRSRYGEFVGYKTDHDPRQRATSVGPYTSRSMVECLEKRAIEQGIGIYSQCRVVDLIVVDGEVVGVLLLRTDQPWDDDEPPLLAIRCRNVVYATGGPAALYSNRVFPHGQWGASGAAYRAGVHGKNVTEWQFGLASLHPRWNVSGTYMQVVPRFISTDEDGNDEREFLLDAIPDRTELQSLIFLKGYQWPFDIRKARDGSSIVDLLVYRETQIRKRRVFLDFRSNVGGGVFSMDELSDEARIYLERAGATQQSPIDRLIHMNTPAYNFYLEKNPGVDLKTEMLEVDVCAQHNNGGLVVDAWWHSNVTGFFPVGEAGGAHGVYRPGGSALNSGQVGATRAAEYIAARRAEEPIGADDFASAVAQRVTEACDLVLSAGENAARGDGVETATLLRRLGDVMSEKAGPVRSRESVAAAHAEIAAWLGELASLAIAPGDSRRAIDRLFVVRDSLITAFVYTHAMLDYVDRGSGSRGSVLYSDPSGTLPRLGDLTDIALVHGSDAPAMSGGSERSAPGTVTSSGYSGATTRSDADTGANDEPEHGERVFSFRLDDGALDHLVQEVAWSPGGGTKAGTVTTTWRERRPIPSDDDFFENVWREFREDGNIR